MEAQENYSLERRRYIGGSDVAAILGLNPWKTNIELWEEKTGLRQPENISQKEEVKRGVNMEPLLRNIFAITRPHLTVQEGRFLVHPDYLFMAANIDGIVDDGISPGVLEIKTARVKNLSDWKDRVPDYYYLQCLHYLAVTGWRYAILYAYLEIVLPDREITGYLREYRIERKEEEIDLLLKAEIEFWDYVQKKIRPNLVCRIN